MVAALQQQQHSGSSSSSRNISGSGSGSGGRQHGRTLSSAFTSSTEVPRFTSNTQSVIEPFSSGTRMARPFSLPFSSA